MKPTTDKTTAREPFRWRYTWRYSLVIGIVLLGSFAVLYDVPLSQRILDGAVPGELHRMLSKTEFFGHAYGIAGMTVTIYLLDESRRRQLVRLVLAGLSAGLASDVVKLIVYRTRPCAFDFTHQSTTFVGVLGYHLDTDGDLFSSANQSFPSAHTASAVAFAMILASMYPRAARWFYFLAIMVGLSRVDGGAHYLSDVCFGAAIGYTFGWLFLSRSRVSCWFDAMEEGPSIAPAAVHAQASMSRITSP